MRPRAASGEVAVLMAVVEIVFRLDRVAVHQIDAGILWAAPRPFVENPIKVGRGT